MKTLLNPRYAHLEEFVSRLPDVFDSTGELLYDRRNKVRCFVVDGKKIVVKRYKTPMWHQRVDYTFLRPSKARRAYLFATRFIQSGIATPEPIACVEVYKGGLFHQGYFVSTFCGDPDLRLLREELRGHDLLMDAFVAFLVDMHQKGILHGDTNLSNFLYHSDSSPLGYHLTTIDINRSHFAALPSRKQCLKSLMRTTHVREVLREIVRRYAKARGWDTEWSVNYVESELDAFERRKKVCHFIQHPIIRHS